MTYISHPLETEGVNVTLSTRPVTSRPLTSNPHIIHHPATHESPLLTVHPLDECRDCHVYTKHVDQSFSRDSAARHANMERDLYLDGIEVGRRLQLEENSFYFSRYRGRLEAAGKWQEELLISREHYRRRVEGLERELMILRDRLLAMQMSYDDVTDNPIWGSHASSPRILPLDNSTNAQGSLYNERNSSEYRLVASDDDDDDEDFALMQQLDFMNERNRHEDHYLNHNRGSDYSDSESDGYDTSSSSSSSVTSHSSSDTDTPANSDDDKLETSVPPVETELSINELSTLIEAAQEVDNDDAVGEARLLVQDAQRTPRQNRTAAQTYLLLTWRTPTWVSSPLPPPVSESRSQPPIVPQVSPATGSVSVPEVFVDASGQGIGLVIKEKWLAWKFSSPRHPSIPVDQHKRVIMSWAELIALELGVLTLIAAGYRDTKVTLRSDNLGVVTAVREKKWTPNHGLEGILQRVLEHCRGSKLRLEVKWVSTKVNPADKPSRGVFPPPSLVFPHAPSLPRHLEGVLQQVIVG